MHIIIMEDFVKCKYIVTCVHIVEGFGGIPPQNIFGPPEVTF